MQPEDYLKQLNKNRARRKALREDLPKPKKETVEVREVPRNKKRETLSIPQEMPRKNKSGNKRPTLGDLLAIALSVGASQVDLSSKPKKDKGKKAARRPYSEHGYDKREKRWK